MPAPSSPRWKPSVSASEGWVCAASRWLVRTVARETKTASPSAAPSWKDAVISDAASPALSAWHAPVGGILNAHHHQAQAGPHDHHPRKDVWQVGAVQRHPGKPEHSGGAQQCPRGDKRPGADLRDPLRCHARSEPDARRQRQVKQASADRRVAQHFLHVERDEEEHRVEGGPPENLGDIGLPQALDLEQRQGHERVAVALLVEQERGDQRNAAGEFPEGPGCAPAGIGGVHQDVDQEKHAARDEAGADRVEMP